MTDAPRPPRGAAPTVRAPTTASNTPNDLRRRPGATVAGPANVESLENRRMLAGHGFGMVVADNAAGNVDRNSALMKEMGVTSIRLWATVRDFAKDRKPTNSMLRAIDYANKGFDVMLIVHSFKGKVPEPEAVRGWFDWAMGNKALKNAVDRWEIENEPDLKMYWSGTIKQYVTNFLKPASEVLRPAGEKVISAGPSWNPDDVQEMINYGALGYVDYIGFHPYANSVSVQTKRIRDVNRIVAGRKPIVATEWNVLQDTKNGRKWAEAVSRAYPQVENGFESSYYFNLTAGHPSEVGPAGTITPGGKKTSFFYAVQTAVNDGVKVPPAPEPEPEPEPTEPEPEPTPTPTPTPSEPAPPTPTPTPTPTTPGKPSTPTPTPTPTPSTPTTPKPTTPKPTTPKPTTPKPSTPKPSTPRPVPLEPPEFEPGTGHSPIKPKPTKPAKPTPKPSTSKPRPSVPAKPATPTPPPPPPSPTVTGMALYNADTDTVIPGYANVVSGVTLDLGKVGTRNIAVVANTVGSRSVVFSMNGQVSLDDARPFASFGDRGNNLLGMKLDKGEYSLSATSYAARGGAGKASKPVSLTFNVTNSATAPSQADLSPEILGLQLQDTKTGLPVAGYERMTASTRVKLSRLPTRAVRVVALTNDDTGSVELINFGKIETLDARPFEAGSVYAKKGKVYLEATAYSADGLAGKKGTTLGMTLWFV